MKKAIIFDLDGTLLNTLPDIHAVLNESLAKFNLPKVSLENTRKFVGDGARKLIERAVGNNVKFIEEVYADYAERFANCKNELTCLYPGEEETLYKLKSAGVSLAIVTNKPQRATDNVYSRFLSKFDFNIVLGQTEYYPLKPNPASTLAILSKLGVKSNECLFVGDGEADVATARAAEVECLSVLWGFRTKEELKAIGAACFAERFTDIVQFALK